MVSMSNILAAMPRLPEGKCNTNNILLDMEIKQTSKQEKLEKHFNPISASRRQIKG